MVEKSAVGRKAVIIRNLISEQLKGEGFIVKDFMSNENKSRADGKSEINLVLGNIGPLTDQSYQNEVNALQLLIRIKVSHNNPKELEDHSYNVSDRVLEQAYQVAYNDPEDENGLRGWLISVNLTILTPDVPVEGSQKTRVMVAELSIEYYDK